MQLHFLLAALLIVPVAALAQGDLDPAGPPAPSMKRLDQIHAGTPIGSAPVTLSVPGHYYLTRNLAMDGDAITITSSDVSLDLLGFTIVASGSGVKAAGSAGAELHNLVISNGFLQLGAPSVHFAHVCNSTLRDLTLSSGTSPLLLEAPGAGQCSGNRIEQCILFDYRSGTKMQASGTGICQGNVLQSCLINGRPTGALDDLIKLDAVGGSCDGNTIRDCTIGPVGSSFLAGIALTSQSGGRTSGNTIERCTISQCSVGIRSLPQAGGANDGNVIKQCAIHDCPSSHGIFLRGTEGTCRGNLLEEVCISKCSSFGIYFLGDSEGGGTEGNVISRCVVSNTKVNGIVVFAGANRGKVADNHVTNVATVGQATGNGINVDRAASNLVIRNTAADVAAPFNLWPGGTNGPIANVTGILGNSGSPNHPWANFRR